MNSGKRTGDGATKAMATRQTSEMVVRGKQGVARPRTGGGVRVPTTDEIRSNPHYSEQVQLRLINLIYDPLATLLFKEAGLDPDEAHLLGLTKINNSREAWFWATQFGKEAAFNRYVHGHQCRWPISKVVRIAFLLARRSMPGVLGAGFTLGVGLAQEQAVVRSEEEGEEDRW